MEKETIIENITRFQWRKE